MHSSAEPFRWRGQRLLGIHSQPAAKAPCVLFLHGVPGAEKNCDIQRALLIRGIGSFALHFAGAWGSDGYYNFSTLISQATAAFRHMEKKDGVDKKRLGIFGFSMGGWTALHTAAGLKEVKAVCAVSPVGPETFRGEPSRQFIAHCAKVLNVKSVPALQKDFELQLKRKDPAKSAAKIKAPLLLVHGDKDEVVPFEGTKRMAVASGARLVRAEGADHSFLDRRGWLSKTAADWLQAQLLA